MTRHGPGSNRAKDSIGNQRSRHAQSFTCRWCGQTFDGRQAKRKADAHAKTCKKNPKNNW